jgi:hypothetical protein
MKTETRYTTGSIWSPEDFQVFKDWLNTQLFNTVVTVNFTKKDGTERAMRCTLSIDHIPRAEMQRITESTKHRKFNADVRAVYDVEAAGWRSFSWNSVKSVIYPVD